MKLFGFLVRYVPILLLSVLLCQPEKLKAQDPEPAWAASFAPQGPEPLRGAIGRTIDGISVYSGNVCAGPNGAELSAAAVLIEVHKRGLIIFDGKSLDALLVSTEGNSPLTIFMNVAEGVSLAGAVIANTDVINLNDRVRKKASFGLVVLAGAARWFQGKHNAKRIDPEKVRAFALPDRLDLPRPLDCWRGTLLGITHDAVTFKVPE